MRISLSIVGAAMLAVASGEACVSARTLTSLKEVVVTKTYEVTSTLNCPPAHTSLPSSAVDDSSPDVPTNKPPGSTTTITSTYVVTACPPEVTDCPIGETSTVTLTTTVCPEDDNELPSPQNPSGTSTADAVEPTTTCDGEEEVASSTDTSSPENPTTSASEGEATSTDASSPEETELCTDDEEQASSTDASSPEHTTTRAGDDEPSSTDASSPEQTTGADEGEEPSSTDSSSPEQTTGADDEEEASSTDASSPEAPVTSEGSSPEETSYTEEDPATRGTVIPESPTSGAYEPRPTGDDEEEEPKESITVKIPATSAAEEEEVPAATSTADKELPVSSSTAEEEELPTSTSTAEEDELPAATSTTVDDDSAPTPPVEDGQEDPVPSTEPAVEPTPTPEAPSPTFTEGPEEPSSTAAKETTTSSTPAPKPTPTEYVRALPADALDLLRDEGMAHLKEYLAHKKSKRQGSGCTLENAMVRREWQDLSVPEREEYIAAVKCLQRLPPKSDFDGARTRYDDFLGTYIGNATDTHKTANFFSYHRYFLHAYETALRDECGYTGAQPYWNWDRTKTDMYNSPMFDGSPTSFGGDGDWEESQGCLTTGPFADSTANMGPRWSLDYNPRCITRLLSEGCATLTTAAITSRLVTRYNEIGGFQDDVGSTSGVYEAGRYTIHNSKNNDVHSWVADPVSHLHHAGIDRLWWIWQLQDLENRIQVIAGPRYRDGHVDGELTDKVYLGVNGEPRMLSELMDTMDGPFCYIYY